VLEGDHHNIALPFSRNQDEFIKMGVEKLNIPAFNAGSEGGADAQSVRRKMPTIAGLFNFWASNLAQWVVSDPAQ